jgi:hypothetical protein
VYEIVDDMVGPGETNYYLLTLEPHFYDLLENNSLSIDIHPYEGNPDLYITVPPRPDSLDDYDWQS